MLKRFLFFLLLAINVTMANAQAPAAGEIMKQATARAKSENKNIILIFHASWCGWCHKMDRSMNDAVCKKFFDDHYVTIHMVVDESADQKNLENPGADEFRKKYAGNGHGIPFWLIFDKNGEFLADSKNQGDNTGCPASAAEVDYFVSVLRKTSSLNEEQLSVIYNRFRKNEN